MAGLSNLSEPHSILESNHRTVLTYPVQANTQSLLQAQSNTQSLLQATSYAITLKVYFSISFSTINKSFENINPVSLVPFVPFCLFILVVVPLMINLINKEYIFMHKSFNYFSPVKISQLVLLIGGTKSEKLFKVIDCILRKTNLFDFKFSHVKCNLS